VSQVKKSTNQWGLHRNDSPGVSSVRKGLRWTQQKDRLFNLGELDRFGQPAYATEATTWISHTFSTTEKQCYLPLCCEWA